MKKLFLITLLLASGAFAAELNIQMDQTNCVENQKLLADNKPAPCCVLHKGVCGCSEQGAVCCDGTGAPGCPCEDVDEKNK